MSFACLFDLVSFLVEKVRVTCQCSVVIGPLVLPLLLIIMDLIIFIILLFNAQN